MSLFFFVIVIHGDDHLSVCRLGVPEGSLVCASTVDFGTVPSGMDTGQRRPAPIDHGGGDAKRIKIEKV